MADGQCTVVGRAIIVVVGLWSQCILLDTNVPQFLQLLAAALSRLILISYYELTVPSSNFDYPTTYMIGLVMYFLIILLLLSDL